MNDDVRRRSLPIKNGTHASEDQLLIGCMAVPALLLLVLLLVHTARGVFRWVFLYTYCRENMGLFGSDHCVDHRQATEVFVCSWKAERLHVLPVSGVPALGEIGRHFFSVYFRQFRWVLESFPRHIIGLGVSRTLTMMCGGALPVKKEPMQSEEKLLIG